MFPVIPCELPVETWRRTAEQAAKRQAARGETATQRLVRVLKNRAAAWLAH